MDLVKNLALVIRRERSNRLLLSVVLSRVCIVVKVRCKGVSFQFIRSIISSHTTDFTLKTIVFNFKRCSNFLFLSGS